MPDHTIHDPSTDDVTAYPHERTTLRCPECGAEPTDESVTKVQLSDLGYAHEDVHYTCSECGHGASEDEKWVHGMPVGEPPEEYYDDLRCDKCEDGWYMIHRLRSANGREAVFDGKCVCGDWKKIVRETDDQGRALLGYPQTTGEINPDNPYGFRSEAIEDV